MHSTKDKTALQKKFFNIYYNLIRNLVFNSGRAGRFGTEHETGEVTTFRTSDLATLKHLLNQDIQPVQVGKDKKKSNILQRN